MSSATTARKIDDLLGKAEKLLAKQQFFETERIAAKAMLMARQEGDFTRMAKLVQPLQAARLGRLQLAVDVGTVTIPAAPLTEDDEIEPGCYVVKPPMVGADARRIRLAALERDVPVAVVCQEPITTLGLCPIVALSGNVVVRTKIDPPADPDQPDLDWILDAIEALGDWAIQTMDPQRPPERYLDELLSRIDAIPEHQGLHQCLEAACRTADEAAQAAGGGRKTKAEP